MASRKIVFKETAVMAAAELVCTAIIVGVFAALGQFRMDVLWGALSGIGIMTLNYFFMAVTVSLAADRAAQGDAQQAQKMVQASSAVRLLSVGALLFICIRLGANVLALVIPPAFARPILMLMPFFRKKGDGWTQLK